MSVMDVLKDLLSVLYQASTLVVAHFVCVCMRDAKKKIWRK